MLLKYSCKVRLVLTVILITGTLSYGAVGSNWIEQWGITWTFDKNISTNGTSGTYQYGQFANGDYWVVGPVVITSISKPHGVNGKDGSMINPVGSNQDQGYDDSQADYNAALDVSRSLPLTLTVNQSLISTVSWVLGEAGCPSQATNGIRPTLRKAAVLTCVASPAPAGSFRPPYCGTDKPLYNVSQLRKDLLPRLDPVGVVPNITTVQGYFQKPWIDHVPDYPGNTYLHPSENLPWYGRELAVQVGDGALILLLNRNDKDTLLTYFVQVGIDLYEIAKTGGAWPPNGGIALGRKFPILFAGLMLNNQAMLTIGTSTLFQEDAQTFYVQETSPGVINEGYGGYIAADIGLPEWGIRHAVRISMDDKSWSSSYRQCCNNTALVGHVLAAHVLGLKEDWGHDALFDYQDRYMAVETDPTWRSWSQFAGAMWDAYRPLYGPVWPEGGSQPASYTLSITASNGSVTKSPNKTTYTFGESVVLTAAANTGYSFVNWSGDATGSTNPVTITMNTNKTVTANFTSSTPVTMPTDTVYQNTNEMTFNATNTYQSISTNGWNLNGTTITLWANPDNLAGRHYLLGHTIGEWSNRIQIYLNEGTLNLGLGSTNTRQTNMATLQTGQWYFISLSWNGTNYTVQVNNQVAGTGTYTGLTTFETFADIGNNGSLTSRTEPFSGSIDDIRIYGRALSNTEVTAIYNNGRTVATSPAYTLTITSNNGTVAKLPNKTAYTAGETVTLTATANAGYRFSGWTGDATGTANPLALTMNSNKAVTANFTAMSLAECMTAHWMLDENTGTTVIDCSGANRTATLINTPTWGYAWANEGWVNLKKRIDAISIPSSALLPQWGTIAVWLEPQSITGTQFIFGHYLNGNRICLYTVAGKLAVGFGSTIALQTNIADLPAGEPVHIALTWNATTYAVYVNAVQKATGTFSGLTALSTSMDIGNSGDPAARTTGFVGLVEDVRTYCRALNASEVQRLYDTYDVNQQKPVMFSIQTVDINGQPVIYQPAAATIPAGAQFVDSETFTWRPWYNQSGNYTVVFTSTGQPVRLVTVSVHDVPLAGWYRQFLVHTGKLE